ncbi:tetratricopeptide repeat protein [Clostridium sp.]|uniref:tetratricopeptide repeat protein n=1 Tax=Clostridium sp. TaxID=1506 RepID=UPI003463B38D
MDKKLKIKLGIFITLCILAVGVITYGVIEHKKGIKALEDQYLKELQEKDAEREEKRKLQEEEKLREEDLNAKCQKAEDILFGNSKNKYDEVIKLTTDIIKEYPDSYRAYTLRGIAYAYKSSVISSNKTKAMEDLDKSLEIKEDYGYGRFNKGLAYALFGEYDEALEWYDKALEVENYHWSHYGKAAIYAKRGDAANSVKNLREAIKIKPDIKDLVKKEAEFDKVRNSKEFKELIYN